MKRTLSLLMALALAVSCLSPFAYATVSTPPAPAVPEAVSSAPVAPEPTATPAPAIDPNSTLTSLEPDAPVTHDVTGSSPQMAPTPVPSVTTSMRGVLTTGNPVEMNISEQLSTYLAGKSVAAPATGALNLTVNGNPIAVTLKLSAESTYYTSEPVVLFETAGDYTGEATFTLDGGETLVIRVDPFTVAAAKGSTDITTTEELIKALQDTAGTVYTVVNDITLNAAVSATPGCNITLQSKAYGSAAGYYRPTITYTAPTNPTVPDYVFNMFNKVTIKGIMFNIQASQQGLGRSVFNSVFAMDDCSVQVEGSTLYCPDVIDVLYGTVSNTTFGQSIKSPTGSVGAGFISQIAGGGKLLNSQFMIQLDSTNGLMYFDSIDVNNGTVDGLTIVLDGTNDCHTTQLCATNHGTIKNVYARSLRTFQMPGDKAFMNFVFRNDGLLENCEFATAIMYTKDTSYKSFVTSDSGTMRNIIDLVSAPAKTMPGQAGGAEPTNIYSAGAMPVGQESLAFTFLDSESSQTKTYTAPAGAKTAVLIVDNAKKSPLSAASTLTNTGNDVTFTYKSPDAKQGKMELECQFVYPPLTIAGTPLPTSPVGGGTYVPVTYMEDAKVLITSIQIDSKLTMTEGDTLKLNPTVLPAGYNEAIKYVSSEPSIVFVDTQGNIDADAPGIATISLSSTNAAAAVQVTVNPAPTKAWEREVLAIVPPIYSSHRAQLENLRATYQAFSQPEKDSITASTLQLFEKYEADLAALEDPTITAAKKWAKDFSDSVALLPAVDKLTLADEPQVVALRTSYTDATTMQQGYVGGETLLALSAAESRIIALKGELNAVKQVELKIDALPKPEDIKLEHEGLLLEVEGMLSKLGTSTISGEHQSKYDLCKAALREWKLAYTQYTDFVNVLQALPPLATVQTKDESAIKNARSAYVALAEKAKTFVTTENLKTLSDYEAALVKAQQQHLVTQANAVVALISGLNTNTPTLADKQTLKAAREAYEALPADAKPYVTNYSQLVALESAFAVYLDKYYKELVYNLVAGINRLPAAKDLTIVDKSAVKSLVEEYTALTADAKPYVTNYATLQAADAEMNKLMEHEEEAKVFTNSVATLGAGDLPTTQWGTVLQLYKQFAELSSYTLRCLTTETKSRIVSLNTTVTNSLAQEVSDATTGFKVTGPIGVKPQLKIECLSLNQSVAGFKNLKSKIEKDSGKALLSLYNVTLLDSGKVAVPYAKVRILMPVQQVYNSFGELGIVIMDSHEKISYIQPSIVTYGGKTYYEYYADSIEYIGVVGKDKSFAWMFSFFGKTKLVPVEGKMLDKSYTKAAKPAKTVPNNAR